MKLITALFLLCIAGIGIPASYGEDMGWKDQTGQLVKNTDDRKAINGFGASVIITTDTDWEKKWNTPAETTPKFTTTDKLKIGEQAAILVFFANPKLDADYVDVTWDIKITRPNNVITENSGLKGFTGKLSGAPENTFLTESIIGFVGEPSDPLGDWIVDINVHDKIREVSIPLRLKFSLAPADSTIEPTTMSEKDLNYFMLYYYLHPAPEKVPQAVQAMHKMGYLEKESAGAPITSFLALIFRSNPSAIETTLADFPGYSPSEQQVLLSALWIADTAQSKMALEKLPLGNDNADLKTSPPKIEELPVESPDVLDMLWGAFMATGDEKYVLPIISVLPYSTIKENIPQFLVGGSAKWSLTSNAVQHKRVFDICSSQLEKQPEDVKEILSEVIAEAANKRAETGG